MNEGVIEITVHYDAMGGIERWDYRWIGGDVARFSDQLLRNADPSEVRFDEFPRKPGDKFQVGPFKLRMLETDPWPCDVIVAVRDRGLVTDLRCFWHRVSRLAQIACRRFIVTLAVWGLADRNLATIPTWRDVHLLQRIGKWTKRKNSD